MHSLIIWQLQPKLESFPLYMQEAQAVVQQVNGFKLDKSHTFAVNLFDDVSRYMQVPDEYEAPEDKEFKAAVSLLASAACLICHCRSASG